MTNMILDMDMKELKEIITDKGISPAPYSKEEIEKASSYFNDLPEKLIEYYQLIGAVTLDEPRIDIYSPDELIKNNKPDAEFIVIAFDYCGMFGLAVKNTDLKESNPVIYLTGEVAVMALEDEEVEEELQDKNLLFETEDEVYISCLTADMSNTLLPELPQDINVLKNLLSAFNFFIKYYAEVETDF